MANFSIRKKIILYAVVPVALFYNLLSVLHIYTSFKNESDEIADRMLDQVAQITHTLDLRMQDIFLQATAQAHLLQNAKNSVKPVLHSTLTSDPLFVSICWIDLQQPHQSVYVKRLGNRAKQYPTPNSGTGSGAAGWSRQYCLPDNSKQLVSLTIPDDNGSMLFRIDIDTGRMMSDVIKPISREHLHTDHEWKFSIVDHNGDYIHTDNQLAVRLGHKNLQETARQFDVSDNSIDFTQLINAGEPQSNRVWIAHPRYQKEFWLFGAPITSTGWWLFTAISRQEILQGLVGIALIDLTVVLISLLLVVAGIWYASRKITQPLIELKTSMDSYIENHRLERIPAYSGQDETGSLTQSFIKLIQWLESREQALHLARANNMGQIVQGLKGSYFYFQLDQNSNVVHISPSIESVLGYSPSDFTGSITRFVYDDDSNQRLALHFRRVLTDQPAEPFELEMVHKNGQHRRIEMLLSQMRSGSEQIAEGLANDVTDRISDTLKFKALLDSAPDAMIILNPDGIIVMINARADELLGFAREELVGMPLSVIVPAEARDSHPLLAPLIERTWEKTRLFRRQSSSLDKKGRIFPAEFTSNPLVTRDGVLISVVIRDITERYRIEQELRTAHDEAIAASRTKSLFLSCMSHELRTPLNGIIGYAQLLQRSSNLDSTEQQKLAVLERCGQHLLTLINDILDLTRIESNGVDLHPTPVNLRYMLGELKELLAPKISGKPLQLQLEISDAVPQWIEVDEVKLRQIVTNLLGNAIKYTDRGKVELIVTASEQQALRLAVIDTGIGIAPEHLERIFDPFKQLNEGLKRGGTGLGLAISRHLVKAMSNGKDLAVSSQPGEGSCFSFEIPIVLATAGSSSDPGQQILGELQLPKDRHYVALVAEKTEVNRTLLGDILEQFGFTTHKTGGGTEALALVDTYHPDLIMMDVNLPGASGVDLLARLRTDPEHRQRAIVAITTRTESDYREELISRGFSDTVEKPFRLNQILQVIAQLLHLPVKKREKRWLTESSTLSLKSISTSLLSTVHKQLQEIIDTGDIQELSSVRALLSEDAAAPLREQLGQILESCDLERLEHLVQLLEKQRKEAHHQ